MGKISLEKVKKLLSPRGIAIQKIYSFKGLPFLLKMGGSFEFYVYYDAKKPFDISFPNLKAIESEGAISDLVKTLISPSDFVLETHNCIWSNINGTVTCHSEHYLLDTEIPIDYIEGAAQQKTAKISLGAKFFVCLKWSEIRELLKNPMGDHLKTVDAEFRTALDEHIKVYHQTIMKNVMDSFNTPSFDSIIFLSKIKEILEFLS